MSSLAGIENTEHWEVMLVWTLAQQCVIKVCFCGWFHGAISKLVISLGKSNCNNHVHDFVKGQDPQCVTSLAELTATCGGRRTACRGTCNVRNICCALHWLGRPCDYLLSTCIKQRDGGLVCHRTFHCAYRVALCSLWSGSSWSSLVWENPTGFDIWKGKRKEVQEVTWPTFFSSS